MEFTEQSCHCKAPWGLWQVIPGIPRHEMSQPSDIARLVETALVLPNNASVSEMLVHCQFEPML